MIRIARAAAAGLCLLIAPVVSVAWIQASENRLELESRAETGEPASEAPIARASDEQFCTVELKRVLRRVLKSCGLIGRDGSTARGCEPLDAKQVATMSGADFNALFLPMRERAGIVQFAQGSSELDESAGSMIDGVFADQRGASYFFVVARASPEGSVDRNRELSRDRAENIMSHLKHKFDDPALEREVGLLWLGEEYAQLGEDFCQWSRSGDEQACRPEDLNRSAFVTWIDCRL